MYILTVCKHRLYIVVDHSFHLTEKRMKASLICSFTIQGETVSKKNSKQLFVKNGKPIITTSANYKKWYSCSVSQIKKQMTQNKFPLNGPLHVEIHFYHKDKRRRDSDNGVSSILDLLSEQGVIEDDNWSVIPEIIVNNDMSKKVDAYCTIELYEYTRGSI